MLVRLFGINAPRNKVTVKYQNRNTAIAYLINIESAKSYHCGNRFITVFTTTCVSVPIDAAEGSTAPVFVQLE